jgi:Ceramidase
MKKRRAVTLLVGVGLLAVALVFSLPRIRQDPSVHQYADQRSWLGIPFTLDVLSNIPFVAAGVAGLIRLRGCEQSRPRWMWAVLFLGITLTGFGSAYYHWRPNNDTLVWDRLPMTIVFTTFFAAMVSERIDARTGQWLCGPMLAIGIASVLYWHSTEVHGASDLRLYGLVQFFPMIAIPVMMLLFPPQYTRNCDLSMILGWYALAIVFQLTDGPVYKWLGFVSGHTLKHLCAGIAAWKIVQMLTRQQRPMTTSAICLSAERNRA